MANYDGKIRVGLELNTEQFKSGANEIKSEYEHLRKSFSDIAKELTKTGDVSAFKKSAESLTKSFIAANMAMSDLIEKAKASSKISVLDISTSLKSINALKGKVGSAIANIEKSGIELNVGLDTDLTSDIKRIYSVLRHDMDGISLDVDIMPKLDKTKVFKELKSTGDIDLDTANYSAQLCKLNEALKDFYLKISSVGSKINTFDGNKLDLVEIFGDEGKVKKALGILATASSMVDIVSERFKEINLVPIIDKDYIKITRDNLDNLLGVYKMYLKDIEKAGICIGKDTEAALSQFNKFYVQAPSKEELERINANSTQANPNANKVSSNVDAEQAKSVEKINKAKQRGVDITNVLTQDEIALSKAAERNLEIEQRINKEREKAAQESSKQPKVEKFNDKVDKVVASSVIDLPKEESKIERLNRLAEEVKVDFANEAEISQVKAKFGELKRLASEIKIELTYKNNLSAISNQLGTVKKAADGIRFNFAKTGDIEQAQKGVEALKNKINELKAQRDSLNDAYEKGIISEIDFRADTADIDRAIDELESETVQIEADIDASSSDTMDLSGIADSLSGKFGKVKMILSTTVEAMKKLFEFADYMVGEFEEAVDTAKKLNSALKKVASTSFDLSRGILAFSHDALEALGITEHLNDTMSSIGFGDLVGADLLADAIRELSSALKDFSNDALDSGSAFQSYYLRISDIFGKSKDVIYDYAKTSTNMLGMSETAYMEAASKIGIFAKGYIKDTEDLTNVTAGLTTAIADLSAQTGFTIDDTMTKLLSGIRGNTEAVEELGINVKVADLQTWLDTEGINAKFENLNSTMQNLYRTWYILDKVQSNGTMGYASKMMDTYSGQVRILQAQLNDLKTTIGTYLMQALVPVLQLANMILSRLIDIANTVGKAFGFLDKYSLADSLGAPDTSGVSDIYSSATDSITGATTAQEELAKATDKTAKAAKKALAPFHQLNILQDNSKSSSTPKTPNVGGSGSTIKTTPTLDTGSVKKPVSEWLKALKDAIKAGEWYDVGRLLGEKVNEIIDKLDFKKYREKLYNGALHLADVFNGLIKTIDFRKLGVKFGDAINTIVNTINLFLDRIDFEEVGTKISDFLRGLLATAEWDKIARFWSQKTRILTDILHGFVESMNIVDRKKGTNGWQELGTAFGEFVTGALDLDWERLGKDIALAMNGVADALISFNDTVDFAGIASRLATGFNNLASTLDGAKLGQSIADTINSAISFISTFLDEANFFSLGMEIGSMLGNALANIDWEQAGDTVVALADGITSLLGGAVYSFSQNYNKIFEGVQSFATTIIDWINDPANQDALASTINTFVDMLVGLVSAIDWEKLYRGIGDTLSKIDWADIIYLMHLDEGIGASFKLIFSKSMLGSVIKVGLEFVGELFKELGSGILKAIKGLVGLVGIVLLGIPATLLARVIQIGASLIDGLIEGITGKASNLREQVDAFFQSVIDWVKDLFGVHSPSTVFAEIGGYLIEGLIQGIQGMWNTITEFFSGAISSLITFVSEKFIGIKTCIENILISLGTSISSIWESIRLGIEVAFNAISTTISSIWTSISSTVINIIGGISSKISEVWNTIHTTISSVINSISTTLSTKWSEIKTNVSTVVTTIKDTVSSIFTTLGTNISSIFEGIKTTVVNVFTSIALAIKSPINGIIGIVESMINFIISGINSAVNAINSFKIELPSITNPITGDTIGGQSFGFSLPTLSSVSLPRLATGAVIQPHHEFAAILGDQKRGVNIEAPLDTIKAGVRDVLGEYGGADFGNLTALIYLGDDLIEEKVVEIVRDNNFRSNGR